MPAVAAHDAIQTLGLTKRFGRTLALDQLNLTVQAGEVFDFLGPNGAGKSTTIRLQLGDLRPSAGQAWIFGAASADAAAAHRHLAYVPADVGLWPALAGAEQQFRQCIAAAVARGQTVFLSSHHLAGVEAICQRVGILRGDRLVAVAELSDLRRLRLTEVDVSFRGTPPDLEQLSAVPAVSNIHQLSPWRLSQTLTGPPTFALLAIPLGVFAAGRLSYDAADEADRRLTAVFARPLMRSRWALVQIAVFVATIVALATALGVATATATALAGANLRVPEALAGVLNFVPAAVLCLGVAQVAIGSAPQAIRAPQAVLALGAVPAVGGFLLTALVDAFDGPDWLARLSPFAHLARVPATAPDWAGAAGTSGVSVLLASLGIAGFARRDFPRMMTSTSTSSRLVDGAKPAMLAAAAHIAISGGPGTLGRQSRSAPLSVSLDSKADK